MYLITFSQSSYDSLMVKHQKQISNYQEYKSNMNERTWAQLVGLGLQADTLINTDKVLIEQYLNREMKKNHELSNDIEKLNLELELYKKESNIQSAIFEQQRFINKMLLIGLIAALVFFLLFLILFIDRHIRFRNIKMELKFQYSKKEKALPPTLDTEKTQLLQSSLDKVSLENNQLKVQLSEAEKQNKDLQENLAEELESRKRVEKEIKALLARLHQSV